MEVGQLKGLTLSILLVVIVIAVGAVILNYVGYSAGGTAEYYEENLTFNSAVPVVLTKHPIRTIMKVYNGSGQVGNVYPVSDLIIESTDSGRIRLNPLNGTATGGKWNNSVMSINYTYVSSNTAFETVKSGEVSLGSLVSWIPLIALIGLAAVIMAIVMAVGRRRDD